MKASLGWPGLGRQLQLLALEDLGDVEVEEVAVEDGLHASGHDGDDVVEAWNKRSTGWWQHSTMVSILGSGLSSPRFESQRF